MRTTFSSASTARTPSAIADSIASSSVRSREIVSIRAFSSPAIRLNVSVSRPISSWVVTGRSSAGPPCATVSAASIRERRGRVRRRDTRSATTSPMSIAANAETTATPRSRAFLRSTPSSDCARRTYPRGTPSRSTRRAAYTRRWSSVWLMRVAIPVPPIRAATISGRREWSSIVAGSWWESASTRPSSRINVSRSAPRRSSGSYPVWRSSAGFSPASTGSAQEANSAVVARRLSLVSRSSPSTSSGMANSPKRSDVTAISRANPAYSFPNSPGRRTPPPRRVESGDGG